MRFPEPSKVEPIVALAKERLRNDRDVMAGPTPVRAIDSADATHTLVLLLNLRKTSLLFSPR